MRVRIAAACPIVAAAFCVFACISTSAGAQRPARGTIPVDLASALVQEGGGSIAPEFLVGAMPAVLTDRIPVFPGSRLLGSMVTSSTATIVVDVPIQADAVRQLVMNELTAKGWTAGRPRMGWTSGGFRPAAIQSPSAYCNDGRAVSFSLAPRSATSTLLKYMVRYEDISICSPPANASPSATSPQVTAEYERPSYPSLEDPLSSSSVAECWMRRASSNSSSSTVVRTSMTPEQLMQYYGKQLADSGWTLEAPEAGARELTNIYVKRDTSLTPLSRRPRIHKITLHMRVSGAIPECRELQYEASTIDR